MKESLVISVAIFALLFLLGKAFDLYARKRHKTRIYDWILRKWYWLDEQKVGNLPVIAAKRIIRVEQWVFGKKLFSWKVLLIAVPISFCLNYLVEVV